MWQAGGHALNTDGVDALDVFEGSVNGESSITMFLRDQVVREFRAHPFIHLLCSVLDPAAESFPREVSPFSATAPFHDADAKRSI